MKFLFACGGTAGHINPAIAVANYIRDRYPDAKFLFAGNPHGMESRLVPQAGYDFAPIEIKGILRQPSWHNLKYNISSLGCIITCWPKATRIIKGFDPDVVIGTGGYVSGPILRQAHKLGYPTVSHESNAFPGLTTKLIAKTADKILLAVAEAQKFLPEGTNCIVTGTPVREEILYADREKARESMNIGDRICILSFGGSLGAQRVNECVAEVIADHCGSGKVHHIHATGAYGVELLPRLLKERNVAWENDPHIDIREYINDMPQCLAAADLVICRAGATTLSELQAAGRASILIPSPNVAENHQYHNAMVLQSHGAAVVIEEKDLTAELLCKKVRELSAHPETLVKLGENASRMAILDANERICKEIFSLIRP